MSKAGQYVFTGISAQADIALLYLLRSLSNSAFQKIIVEGNNWDDFTLIYDNNNDNYEVKWYSKPISLSNIKTIIENKIKKPIHQNERFSIICKYIGNTLQKKLKSLEYLDYFSSTKNKCYKNHKFIKELHKKGWTNKGICLLRKINIIQLNSNENVIKNIKEQLALQDPFYLCDEDQNNLIAKTFKLIMNKGAIGGIITRKDFIGVLNKFKSSIAEFSETFSPEISIMNKIENINKYLTSENEFKKLNDKKYLTPISLNSRIIFYITDKIEKSNYSIDSIDFFIRKILIKKQYIRLSMRLLKKKNADSSVPSLYVLNFITDNYAKLSDGFNCDDALEIISDIALKDINGQFRVQIFNLLTTNILIEFSMESRFRSVKRQNGWHIEEFVAKIFNSYYGSAHDKKEIIDLVFKYYDFTADDFSNISETHPEIYKMVRLFILDNWECNYQYVLDKIVFQFNLCYSNKYKGYEWIGSGISQAGSTYSITDKAIVRLIFAPLFEEAYRNHPEQVWNIIEDKILKHKISKSNPAFLKRSVIPIILDRMTNISMGNVQKRLACEYLDDIVRIKDGIPHTSDIVFDKIRSLPNIDVLGYENIMKLINIDSNKYKRHQNSYGFPSSIFTIMTCVILIKNDYAPAKDFILRMVKRREFAKHDRFYDLFELLVEKDIPNIDPELIIKIWCNIDIERYLRAIDRHDIGNKSLLLTGIIKKDWAENKKRGEILFKRILNKRTNNILLNLLRRVIDDLSEINPIKTYALIYRYLKTKAIFRRKFAPDKYFRENIVHLSERLIKVKAYSKAKRLIDYCIDDSDPQTHNREEDFNYHLQIKNGETHLLISTVRGRVAWALHELAITNQVDLMAYALNRAEILVDLDGKLAKQLGHAEPNYYVRLQALAPLLELAHPIRRKMLDNYQSGLGMRIKHIVFNLLKSIDRNYSENNKPIAIIEGLVNIFSYVRAEYSESEARAALEIFEKHNIEKAYFLFIYYAIYRELETGFGAFDSEWYKSKLTFLCSTENVFRKSISWDIWRSAYDNKSVNIKIEFNEIEIYWKMLFEIYNKEVYDHLYNTLEITLAWPDRYNGHLFLLKKAIKMELDSLAKNNQQVNVWGVTEKMFEIVKHHSTKDFLETYLILLENIDSNLIWYYDTTKFIEIFKTIHPESDHIDIYNRISQLLLMKYPDLYERE